MVVSTQGTTSAIGQVRTTILNDQHQGPRPRLVAQVNHTQDARATRARTHRKPRKEPDLDETEESLGGRARVIIDLDWREEDHSPV